MEGTTFKIIVQNNYNFYIQREKYRQVFSGKRNTVIDIHVSDNKNQTNAICGA